MLWESSAASAQAAVVAELARKVVALRPTDVRHWELLGQSLLQMDRPDEAVAALTDAIEKLPATPKFHLLLADACQRLGRRDLFERAMQRVPAIPDDDSATAVYRLELLMKAAAANDVCRIAREVLALDPTHHDAIEHLASAARRDATPEAMIPICRAALSRQAGHVQARYELAAACARLGCSEEARKLIDLDRFVMQTDVVAPGKYADAAAFEAALSGEITRNPTLKPDPVDKATRGCLQTSGDLALASGEAIATLLDLVRAAVEAFVAALPAQSDDPFVAARPERAALDAWVVVFPGEGYLKPHIHASGWLSGVYYVGAPEIPGNDSRAGCLALGSLDLPDAADPPWGIVDVRPAPGRLVLFPSFIPHATVPTKSTKARICVAFDVIPGRPDPMPFD